MIDGVISQESQIQFKKELFDYCMQNRIVSQFIRFHPLLDNHNALPDIFETRYLRDTIYIDTSSPELIMQNMDGKNRNMVRKAVKNGVSIQKSHITDFSAFIPMYIQTMERNQADSYYFFNKEYFDSLKGFTENACIFYAMMNEIPICGAIVQTRFVLGHWGIGVILGIIVFSQIIRRKSIF